MLQLVLLVALGFIVGVVVLVASVFLLLRWWVKRKISDVAESMADTFASSGDLFEVPFSVPMPPRVHLQKRESLAWRDQTAVELATQELRGADFLHIGDFTIQEIPGLMTRAFHDPAQRFYAVVYDYALAGEVFLDLHARFSDNRTIAITNASRGEEIAASPNHTKIYEKNAPISALIARMNAELGTQPTQAATPPAFVPEYERAYAVGMDFQIGRGGPTLDEIRRGAQLRGETYDDATFRATHRQSREQYAVMLELLMREKFVESGQISASQWEAVRDDLIIVHDRHSDEDVAMKFISTLQGDDFDEDDEEQLFDVETLKARIKTMPPRDAFAFLINDLPPESQPVKLATLNDPVPTDIYAAPTADD